MLKKLSSISSIAVLMAVAGCSTQKSNSLRGLELTPGEALAIPMTAELNVADKKALGQAKGKVISKHDLEQEAIAEALKPTNADVLVGASHFYVEKGGELTVTVVGYPAHYKNFKLKEVPQAEAPQAGILLGGDFYYTDGSNDLSVIVKTKPDAQQNQPTEKPQETILPAPVPVPTPTPAQQEDAQ